MIKNNHVDISHHHSHHDCKGMFTGVDSGRVSPRDVEA